MTTTARLHEAVAAVAPIHGVGVGHPGDKRTWRIDFRAEATKAQRTAARAVLDAFDWHAVPPAAVKAEAGRRILARFPEFKQRNAPRGTPGSEAMWDWIDDVRAASNKLEAMTPIPADFAADKHWPAA